MKRQLRKNAFLKRWGKALALGVLGLAIANPAAIAAPGPLGPPIGGSLPPTTVKPKPKVQPKPAAESPTVQAPAPVQRSVARPTGGYGQPVGGLDTSADRDTTMFGKGEDSYGIEMSLWPEDMEVSQGLLQWRVNIVRFSPLVSELYRTPVRPDGFVTGIGKVSATMVLNQDGTCTSVLNLASNPVARIQVACSRGPGFMFRVLKPPRPTRWIAIAAVFRETEGMPTIVREYLVDMRTKAVWPVTDFSTEGFVVGECSGEAKILWNSDAARRLGLRVRDCLRTDYWPSDDGRLTGQRQGESRADPTPVRPAPIPNPPTTALQPLFPLPGGIRSHRVNTNFGAFGNGPIDDPNTYIGDRTSHPGTDLQATACDPNGAPNSNECTPTPVLAPVSGEIVFYHRKGNAVPLPKWINTFIVLRGDDGRDYIFGHTECTKCTYTKILGDSDIYPPSARVRVTKGEQIGKVAYLRAEGYGNHLHLGVSTARIVTDEGRLKPAYWAGKWGYLGEPGVPGGVPSKQAGLDIARDLHLINPSFIWDGSAEGPVKATAEETAAWIRQYRDVFLSADVNVTARTTARVRDLPTSDGSRVLRELAQGDSAKGRWVQGRDPTTRWLKLSDTNGYVWEGNLQENGIVQYGPVQGPIRPQPMPSSLSELLSRISGLNIRPGLKAVLKETVEKYGSTSDFSTISENLRYAELANAAYSDTPDVKGWEDISSLFPDYTASMTGFRAFVFQNKSEVVISFRGTDTARDWATNLTLGEGQLLQAAKLYVATQTYCQCKVTLTGHSLGGGLAQVIAASSRTKGVAFDPAPFAAAISKLPKSAFSNVISFRNSNDPLTMVSGGLTVGKMITVKNTAEISTFQSVALRTSFNHKMDFLFMAMQAVDLTNRTLIEQGLLAP